MTAYQFKLPDVGEGIAEAEIVAWHVAVGDRVEEDAPLADVMTDKATVEISSPVSGTVTRISGEVGDQVAIGSVLAEFDVDVAAQSVEPQAEAPGAPQPFTQPPAATPEDAADGAEVAEVASGEVVAIPSQGGGAALGGNKPRVSASPAVRQRATELGIDLALVEIGVGDRVRHRDLDTYLSYNQSYRTSRAIREDQEVPVIGLRRRIAENMAASKRHIPHFTYVEEIDVTKLEVAREELNASRGERPKLTMLPFIAVAVCKAVVDYPMLNARFDDEAGVVTRSGAVHLGIATQTDNGLMVPVVRDAHDRNIWQLASEVRRLADSARSGKASSSELSGSTLTITSLGTLGGVATTPVINRPEVAIIGPNRVVERPVIRNGEIQVAKLMNLSISCDHRVVDGWDAASFVQRLKQLLEAPSLLFVD